VGLELTDARGVHDGTVLGIPYFECPSARGVFAQPAQLSASGAVSAIARSAATPSVVAPARLAAMAADEGGPTTLPSKARTADGSISLGQQVMWTGKKSIVRYIGAVRFAAGEWVGLELTDARGVHDGNVMGIPYFECPAAKGVFAQPAQLSASGAITASAPVVAPSAAPTAVASDADEVETLPSKEKTADGSAWLGQQVLWKGKQGVVRYIGDVRFAAGEWIGIEMLEARGMHDGNVLGVSYFKCSSGKGIFAQLSHLQTTGTRDSAAVEETLRQVEASVSAGVASGVASSLQVGQRVMWKGRHAGMVRFVGPVEFATGVFVGVELEDPVGYYDGTFMGQTYFKCEPGKGIFAHGSMLNEMAII